MIEIAKFRGLSPRLAEVDYIQDIALLNVHREFGGKLVFKGGTCLYKAYNLGRFSEDLDFTAKKGFKHRQFFSKLPFFFNLLNMRSRVSIKKFEKNITARLEVNGPLYDGRKESVCTVIFDISLRERVLLPVKRHAYMPAYSEIRPFDLSIMDEKEILAEKIRAIYERNKARDVYDLWYLLEKKNVDFDIGLVKKKLMQNELKFEKETFLNKIAEKKGSWKKDLEALVSFEPPPFLKAEERIRCLTGLL